MMKKTGGRQSRWTVPLRMLNKKKGATNVKLHLKITENNDKRILSLSQRVFFYQVWNIVLSKTKSWPSLRQRWVIFHHFVNGFPKNAKILTNLQSFSKKFHELCFKKTEARKSLYAVSSLIYLHTVFKNLNC